MTRPRAWDRLPDLIEAATRVFISKGYRRAQMEDVTQALGLSPAAVYRYVESKEALFDLLVRAGAAPGRVPGKIQLPIPTPRPGSTLAFLRRTLKREGRLESLEMALARRQADKPRAEWESIVRELYSRTARYRVGIKLLDRSSLDWPELAAIWSGQWRGSLVKKLARYLKLRIRHRQLRPVPDATAAARLVVETVAFFAMHRHYDPSPTLMSDAVAEETAVDALVHAFTKNRRQAGGKPRGKEKT